VTGICSHASFRKQNLICELNISHLSSVFNSHPIHLAVYLDNLGLGLEFD